MSILDVILLICFIPALIQGLKKGFISQVISIVSLIAGVWMSFEFSTAVSAWLAQYVEASEKLLKIASFAIIMIGVFIILGIVGKSLEGILKFVMLGWLNRLLGVVFAFIKTGLVIGIVIILFNSLNNSLNLVSEETLAQSVLYPPLKDMAYTIFPYLKEIFFWNA
ncbi:MAG: CvpA family protein [Bacteroidales bacterium]|nr:CvpA family protein [Bacteroidales bacterium]